MAAVSSILAGAAILATVAQVRGAEEARDQANDQRKKDEIKANALASEAEKRSADEKEMAKNEAVLQEQKRKKRALSAGAGGRRSTILTSPLGVAGGGDSVGGAPAIGAAPASGAQNGSGKSLLGV